MSRTAAASFNTAVRQYPHTAITEAAERNTTSAPQPGHATFCINPARSTRHLAQYLRLRGVVIGLPDEPLVEHRLELFELRHGIVVRGRDRALRGLHAFHHGLAHGHAGGEARADTRHAAFVLRSERNGGSNLVL